jgi:hypothetical protein
MKYYPDKGPLKSNFKLWHWDRSSEVAGDAYVRSLPCHAILVCATSKMGAAAHLLGGLNLRDGIAANEMVSSLNCFTAGWGEKEVEFVKLLDPYRPVDKKIHRGGGVWIIEKEGEQPNIMDIFKLGNAPLPPGTKKYQAEAFLASRPGRKDEDDSDPTQDKDDPWSRPWRTSGRTPPKREVEVQRGTPCPATPRRPAGFIVEYYNCRVWVPATNEKFIPAPRQEQNSLAEDINTFEFQLWKHSSAKAHVFA